MDNVCGHIPPLYVENLSKGESPSILSNLLSLSYPDKVSNFILTHRKVLIVECNAHLPNTPYVWTF